MSIPRIITAATFALVALALAAGAGGALATYLALFWTGASIVAGALLIAACDELTGGAGWSAAPAAALRPIMRRAWLLLPAFLPIALTLQTLYSWTDQPQESARAARLNTPVFLLRSAVYLLLWAALALVLSGRRRRPRPRLACSTLLLVALTASFADVDWIGSLDARWYSSILGLYLLIGQALTAYAVGVLLAAPRATTAQRRDMGNILLTLVLTHAYLGFSQFFIIWNGNTISTISWYLPRTAGLWGAVALALVLLHFAIPQAALLWRAAKQSAAGLRAIAAVLLLARALEAAWLVLPASPRAGPGALAATLLVVAALALALLPPRPRPREAAPA
jgi:hypothetical protein